MITIIVQVDVKPENIQNFIDETKTSKEGSLKEPGCCGYTIFQSLSDPTKFTLSELYESEEAIESHKKTSHFLAWRENVQPMMANPRIGNKYKAI